MKLLNLYSISHFSFFHFTEILRGGYENGKCHNRLRRTDFPSRCLCFITFETMPVPFVVHISVLWILIVDIGQRRWKELKTPFHRQMDGHAVTIISLCVCMKNWPVSFYIKNHRVTKWHQSKNFESIFTSEDKIIYLIFKCACECYSCYFPSPQQRFKSYFI